MSTSAIHPPKVVRCPICRKDGVTAYRPFCSKRCADIDLGKWFSGGYAIAGRDGEHGDEASYEPAATGRGDDSD